MDESLVVVRGGVDQVADDLFGGPLAGRGRLRGAGVGDGGETRGRVCDAGEGDAAIEVDRCLLRILLDRAELR